MYSLKNTILFLLLFLFLIILSVVVGTRDVSVGTDTANYTDFFHNVEFIVDSSRFELLFKYLTYGVKLTTNNPELYFAIIFLLFNYIYIYFYFRAIGEKSKRVENIIILFGLMLSSSWYVVATTNGLRQGLSLPLMYLSLLFFSERKIIFSILFFGLSLGFHVSSILVLPFVFFVFLRERLVLFVFIFSAFLYFLGATEILVAGISDFLSISLYSDIINYSSESNNWVGFQADFFLYTVFFGVFFYFFQRYINKKYIENYIRLWKFYCVLMMPYFFFGFGAYSNRYALIGWLFLPVIQTFFIISSRFSNRVKLFLGCVFFIFGFLSYLFLVLGFSL